MAVPSQNVLPIDASAKQVSGSYCTNLCSCKECENKPHNQVTGDKGVNESEKDEWY